jgi:hypothetical protein
VWLASLLNASKQAAIENLCVLVASHHIPQQDAPILVAYHAQIILLLSLGTSSSGTAILRIETLLPFGLLLDLLHNHTLPNALAGSRVTSRSIGTRPKAA